DRLDIEHVLRVAVRRATEVEVGLDLKTDLVIQGIPGVLDELAGAGQQLLRHREGLKGRDHEADSQETTGTMDFLTVVRDRKQPDRRASRPRWQDMRQYQTAAPTV